MLCTSRHRPSPEAARWRHGRGSCSTPTGPAEVGGGFVPPCGPVERGAWLTQRGSSPRASSSARGQVEVRNRMKLLQFHQDHRPPYWGTWSKTSKEVTGRRPLGRDSRGILNYEYDSEGGFCLCAKAFVSPPESGPDPTRPVSTVSVVEYLSGSPWDGVGDPPALIPPPSPPLSEVAFRRLAFPASVGKVFYFRRRRYNGVGGDRRQRPGARDIHVDGFTAKLMSGQCSTIA